MSKRRVNRDIKVKSDFFMNVNDLLKYFKDKIYGDAEDYWDNVNCEYKDGYYMDIWNCFEFYCDIKEKVLVIQLRGESIYSEAEEDCDRFHNMSNEELVKYVKDEVLEATDISSKAFKPEYSDYELTVLRNCIMNWEVLTPSIPQLTHKDLVKMLGYDFEYKA